MKFHVARDNNGDLYLFGEKPERSRECWWATAGVDGTYLRLDKTLFPQVTWETEPLPVAVTPIP